MAKSCCRPNGTFAIASCWLRRDGFPYSRDRRAAPLRLESANGLSYNSDDDVIIISVYFVRPEIILRAC